MFTRNGKSVTSIRVKPICTFQQVFKSTWLSGAFSPITGDHFQLILPHCNADNFQVFLNDFSKENTKELKIMVLDNGRFHKAKRLIIPENIVLVFLPPYSPELNGSVERGNDTFRYSFVSSSGRNTYAWGDAGSDFFELYGKQSLSIDWVMDFDARNPDVGGDKIQLNYPRFDFNWVTFGTNLEKKSADDKHPFLSEGAEYYDLQINRGTDLNNPIWFSILNLVGVDGTEITLQGLIDNGNLV